ncbi:hypothetical protein GQ55_3G180900 [Panicum hallii var. hallii]|uniref:Uncharacterized protein n=1 Tax=Panicum hallii var. hallii TaxID=1504633 RepID=A0A2T7EAP5_9POAL|nr:hypothetical protein GQ55_3G180900 [Panicum hallii var. hallii]
MAAGVESSGHGRGQGEAGAGRGSHPQPQAAAVVATPAQGQAAAAECTAACCVLCACLPVAARAGLRPAAARPGRPGSECLLDVLVLVLRRGNWQHDLRKEKRRRGRHLGILVSVWRQQQRA